MEHNLFSNETMQGSSFNDSSNDKFVCFCSSLSLSFTQVCVIILSCKQLQAYANVSLHVCSSDLGEFVQVSVFFEGKLRQQFEARKLLVGFLNN